MRPRRDGRDRGKELLDRCLDGPEAGSQRAQQRLGERRLGTEELRETRSVDREREHFAFCDDGLTWKNVAASTEEVAAARRDFVTSFGSCSFDEPRDDLRALGWL